VIPTAEPLEEPRQPGRMRFGDPAQRLRANRQTDVWILGICLAVVLAAALLRVNAAADGVVFFGHQLPEVCNAKKAGIPCPGCGLTRSFVLGVRLDPAAFRLHRLGPLFLLLVVAQIPYRAWRLWRVRTPADLPPTGQRAGRVARWVFPALIVGLLLNWIVNLTQQFVFQA